MDRHCLRYGLALLGVCLVGGCGSGSHAASNSSAANPSAATATKGVPATTGGGAAASDRPGGGTPVAEIGDNETWDILSLQGKPIGYLQTTVRRVVRDGRDALEITGRQQIAVKRYKDVSEQTIEFTSHETADGQLLDFEIVSAAGGARQTAAGKVVGEQLEMQIGAADGKTERHTIAWPRSYGGFFAPNASLLRRPLTPGEKRSVTALTPLVPPIVVHSELTAAGYEMTPCGGKNVELMRINETQRFGESGGSEAAGGNRATAAMPTLQSELWCDRTGDVLKQRMAMLEVQRSTKAEALKEPAEGRVDINLHLAVPLDRPIADPHKTRRVDFVVELDHADPAAVFPQGASQHVVSRGPHTAAVTVFAVRPDQSGNASAPPDPPTRDDLLPNGMIQSDDATVIQRANEAAGDESDPWQFATRLERYVHSVIRKKDFSQAFASAAEVARDLEGDCTEHAVLLAALCRAKKIPARVAMGLVYVDGQPPTMQYHMWTEVFVAGKWIPLDGTLGLGGTGAAYLKIGQSNLAGDAAVTSMLPVMQVAGQLRVHVASVE